MANVVKTSLGPVGLDKVRMRAAARERRVDSTKRKRDGGTMKRRLTAVVRA